jgi:hypothetical protein
MTTGNGSRKTVILISANPQDAILRSRRLFWGFCADVEALDAVERSITAVF